MTRWGVHFDKQKQNKNLSESLPEFCPNIAQILPELDHIGKIGGGGGTVPPDPPPPRLIYLYAVSYVHAVQTTCLLRYPISEFALIPDFTLPFSPSLLEYCNEAFILLSSNFHLTDSKVQTQFRKTQYNSIWEGIGWSYLEENKRWEINVLGLRLFC